MKRTIVYLDGEPECLSVFRETFGGSYDVRTATTPAEARRMLAERPADIVISDRMMAELGGKGFLREVAEGYPSSYRVLLSGALMVGHALAEVGAGVVHAFVVKPWTKAEMLRVLERADYVP